MEIIRKGNRREQKENNAGDREGNGETTRLTDSDALMQREADSQANRDNEPDDIEQLFQGAR